MAISRFLFFSFLFLRAFAEAGKALNDVSMWAMKPMVGTCRSVLAGKVA